MIVELDLIYDGQVFDVFIGDFVLIDWGCYVFMFGIWIGEVGDKDQMDLMWFLFDNKVYFVGVLF